MFNKLMTEIDETLGLNEENKRQWEKVKKDEEKLDEEFRSIPEEERTKMLNLLNDLLKV